MPGKLLSLPASLVNPETLEACKLVSREKRETRQPEEELNETMPRRTSRAQQRTRHPLGLPATGCLPAQPEHCHFTGSPISCVIMLVFVSTLVKEFRTTYSVFMDWAAAGCRARRWGGGGAQVPGVQVLRNRRKAPSPVGWDGGPVHKGFMGILQGEGKRAR